jgi:hypothetical protein
VKLEGNWLMKKSLLLAVVMSLTAAALPTLAEVALDQSIQLAAQAQTSPPLKTLRELASIAGQLGPDRQ